MCHLIFAQDGGNEWVVKCVNWKMLTGQAQPILPSQFLDEADVLLHTSPNADTVFIAKACVTMYTDFNELM